MFPLEPADGAFLTDPAGEFLISSSIFQGEPSLDPDSFYQTLGRSILAVLGGKYADMQHRRSPCVSFPRSK
jgi:hypothetical protein